MAGMSALSPGASGPGRGTPPWLTAWTTAREDVSARGPRPGQGGAPLCSPGAKQGPLRSLAGPRLVHEGRPSWRPWVPLTPPIQSLRELSNPKPSSCHSPTCNLSVASMDPGIKVSPARPTQHEATAHGGHSHPLPIFHMLFAFVSQPVVLVGAGVEGSVGLFPRGQCGHVRLSQLRGNMPLTSI